MSCQQLTAVCVFITSCQIASSQLSYTQRLALLRNYPHSMLKHGVLRRPPSGYHYETRRHISNTYPRNSYRIKFGLANVVRNNNLGSSSPSKGGKKIPKKRNKKKKSNDEDEGGMPDDTSPTATRPSAAESPPAESPPAESPPAESPPAESPPS